MMSITNLRGTIPVEIKITSPTEQEVLRAEAEVASDDPLAVLDLPLKIMGLPLTEYGTYFVDVFTGDQHLGCRRIKVTQLTINRGEE